jgi:hypothetical protein
VATTTQDLSGYISTTTALSSYLTLDQTIPQTATGTFTFPKVVSPMIDFGNKTTLVTNGTFTTDLTGWTDASNSPSNIIWETGWLKLVVSSAATARARQSVTTEIGKTYMFTFNTKTYKAQTGFKLGTTLGGGEYYNIAADGTSYLSNEYKFTATTTTTYIEFNAGTIAYGYIDDVKLYQYAGNISGLTVDNSLIVGKNIYADRIQLPRYDGGVGVQPSLTIGNFGGANFASGYGVALGIVGGMAMQRVSDTSYSYLFSVRSADASTPLFRIFSNNSATPDFTIGNMVSNKSLNFDTNVQGVDSTGLQVGPAITVNRSTSFVQPTAGLGTISVSAGGTTVTGVGTLFLSTFKVGDTITSEGQTKTISAIASNTSLTTDAWGAAISAKAFTLTGGTRMVVNGNGNVGIRTTTPTGALHVVGDGTATRWLGLFTQTGVTPENSLTGSSVQNKMVSVQGSDGAFFMGRDVTNDIEFVMGTSVVGEVFAGAMTAHDMSLRTNNTDRLTVKATTGNVGIGTTTPTAKFTVYGQAPGTNGLANFIETSSSNAGAGMTGYADYTRAMATGERLGYFVLGGAKDNAHTLVNSAAITAVAAENWSSTAAGSDLTFNVTPKLSVTRAEKMRILSSGNVGIGTSTPSATLTVLGTLQFSSLGSSGANLTTDSLGNVSASSDERLKDIQGSYQRGLADIMKIDPIRYKWKVETGYDTLNTYSGFSAQNMTLAIPEAVATSSSGFLTLADRPIIAALVNSVKQIGSFISKIQGGIAYLKNIVAETFAVGSQEKPSGITMYDESTGNPYCVKITNGILINEDGACGTIEPSESMFDYTATVLDTENSIASSTATSTESVSSTSTDSVISTSTDSISTSTTSITSGVSTTTEQTVASTTDDIIATSTTETEISTSTATTTSESEISTSTESVADVSENVEEALPYTEGETSVTNPVEQVIVQGAPTTTPESIEQIISVVEEVSTTTPAEETLQAPEENQNTDSTTELQQGASVFDIKISNQNLLIIIILVIQSLMALAFGFYIYDRRKKS